MEDERIIELFFARDEQAIDEVSAAYGTSALRIGKNLLRNDEDAKECLNDAYLALWNSIPPERPRDLFAYFCGVMRNISLSAYHRLRAEKRDGRFDVPLSDIEEIIPSGQRVDEHLEAEELTALINRYLSTLDRTNLYIFVRRFWYYDEIAQISEATKISSAAIYRRLDRMKAHLAKFLADNGVFL